MKKKRLLSSVMVLSLITVLPLQAATIKKNETVYTNLDLYGSEKNTVVVNHIMNVGSTDVKDETMLKDILNVNGDEEFSLSNNNLTWQGDNQDIYYQGYIEKKLPIDVKTTYYLDGIKTDVKDMKNKKGKVKIKFEFTNNDKHKVNGNTLYTPFVTTVGFMLNSENNNNVTIDNGKVISTGERNMVVGIASPGLYESLDLSDLKKLNQLTVEYETTKFSIGNIYIVSTPELLNETSFDVFNKMDKLTDSINELKENMDKIEQGAKQLLDGATELNTGAEQLSDSLKTVNSAIKELQKGSVKLDKGLTTILTELKKSEKELKNQKAQIEQLQTQNKNTANKIINELIAGVTADQQTTYLLNTILSSITKTDVDFTQLTKAQKIDMLGLIYKTYGTTTDFSNFGPYATHVQTMVKTISNNYGLYYLLNLDYNAIKSLSKNLNTLIKSLEDAITKAEKGSSTLSDGLTKVKTGMTQIYNGAVTLSDGTGSLKIGVKTLTEGIETFNEKGICVLSDYAKKLDDYGNKAKELVKLSKNFKGYGSDNADTTIFVYNMN